MAKILDGYHMIEGLPPMVTEQLTYPIGVTQFTPEKLKEFSVQMCLQLAEEAKAGRLILVTYETIDGRHEICPLGIINAVFEHFCPSYRLAVSEPLEDGGYSEVVVLHGMLRSTEEGA